MEEKNCQLLHHLYGRYVTDVRFHQFTRSTGSYNNVKYGHSKKRKTPGLKIELSVISTGLCGCSNNHEKGNILDIHIFRKYVALRRSVLRSFENDIVNTSPMGYIPEY